MGNILLVQLMQVVCESMSAFGMMLIAGGGCRVGETTEQGSQLCFDTVVFPPFRRRVLK